jgi:hypothetical protein
MSRKFRIGDHVKFGNLSGVGVINARGREPHTWGVAWDDGTTSSSADENLLTKVTHSKSTALAEYNKLPVTSSPAEFLDGHGGGGLTSEEFAQAKRLARIIVGSRHFPARRAKKASKPRAKRSRKWIQKAIKPSKKGALHKALHVPAGKKIPLKTLRAAARKKGVTGKRARLALTMRGFKHSKKRKAKR